MRKIKIGMVGGGAGAFIGNIHRMAMGIDGKIELVCGAFSSDATRSKESGKALFLNENRCYGSYDEMFDKEAELSPAERMDAVCIVTPNHMHFPVAQKALQKGFHVISDKPATFTYQEAIELQKLVNESNLLYALTHNYTGYPLVKHAKGLIEQGEIGDVRKVIVEYLQGWLATPLEKENKQASWRLDPSKAGKSCCLGDIGTHAENLVEYITGLEMVEVAADFTSFVEGRALEDDASLLFHLENGAKGVLLSSQISIGEENGLKIRIYGSKGSLKWEQQNPNSLIRSFLDRGDEIIRAGEGYLSPKAQDATRLPPGHPEGYLEAFANIYLEFAKSINDRENNIEGSYDFPSIDDGVRGLNFIEKSVLSSENNSSWQKLN